LLDELEEDMSYIIVNYTPLIFINGSIYKGSYDNVKHLLESFCNSYEYPPDACNNLDIFAKSNELNSKKLTHFIVLSCLICFVIAFLAIVIFYILMKRKFRKRFNFELNDKINEVLAEYYKEDNEKDSDAMK